jgi:polar amino acid transport system substrate-binding protein
LTENIISLEIFYAKYLDFPVDDRVFYGYSFILIVVILFSGMNIRNLHQKKSTRFSIRNDATRCFLRVCCLYLIALLLLSSCSGSVISPNESTTIDNETPTQNQGIGLETIKERGRLIVGTSITKPFEYYEQGTQNIIGLDVDMANYIAGQLGVEIQWIEIPFANLLPALQEEKIDIAIAGIYSTPERKQLVDFSIPYLETGLIIVVQPDLYPNIHSINDIEGMNIGVKIGATGEALAEELQEHGMDIQITRYQDTLDSLLDLEVGRVDSVFNDYLNTLFYIKENNSTLKIVENESKEVLFLSNATLGIAVNKKNKDLLEEINKILLEMNKDGTINEYYQKWLISEDQP